MTHTRRKFMYAAASLALPAWAQEGYTGGDPLGSMQYPSLRDQLIGKAEARFTDSVVVKGPATADDAMNVPLLVDARGLADTGGGVVRIRVGVDRNPIRHVLDFVPTRAQPMLAFRVRLEQASPVRAFVQTSDGRWHVGSTLVDAAGGGCTLPGATRTDGTWSRTLGHVQVRLFNNHIDGVWRLRLRVMHPMDTGLISGIPAFYIEQLQLQDPRGEIWWKLFLHEPVSENPLFTFQLPAQLPNAFFLIGHDNNGNRIYAEITV